MDEYAKFRNATGCGWITGTVYTGPQICGKPVKFTVTDPDDPAQCTSTINGKVCGIHGPSAVRRGYIVTAVGDAATFR